MMYNTDKTEDVDKAYANLLATNSANPYDHKAYTKSSMRMAAEITLLCDGDEELALGFVELMIGNGEQGSLYILTNVPADEIRQYA